MPEYCDIPVLYLYIYLGRLKLKLHKIFTVILFQKSIIIVPVTEKDSFARTNTNEADAITYDDVVRQLFYDSARVQQMIR